MGSPSAVYVCFSSIVIRRMKEMPSIVRVCIYLRAVLLLFHRETPESWTPLQGQLSDGRGLG